MRFLSRNALFILNIISCIIYKDRDKSTGSYKVLYGIPRFYCSNFRQCKTDLNTVSLSRRFSPKSQTILDAKFKGATSVCVNFLPNHGSLDKQIRTVIAKALHKETQLCPHPSLLNSRKTSSYRCIPTPRLLGFEELSSYRCIPTPRLLGFEELSSPRLFQPIRNQRVLLAVSVCSMPLYQHYRPLT